MLLKLDEHLSTTEMSVEIRNTYVRQTALKFQWQI